MIKRRISQEDMVDINVQGMGNATMWKMMRSSRTRGNSICKMIVEVIISEILELS